MATIQKRKTKKGTSYRVMIRQHDGFPPAHKTFPTLQEAKDWSKQEEARGHQGSYFPGQTEIQHTHSDLIDRYITIILPTKPKNAKDTQRHLQWWKERLGKYGGGQKKLDRNKWEKKLGFKTDSFKSLAMLRGNDLEPHSEKISHRHKILALFLNFLYISCHMLSYSIIFYHTVIERHLILLER